MCSFFELQLLPQQPLSLCEDDSESACHPRSKGHAQVLVLQEIIRLPCVSRCQLDATGLWADGELGRVCFVTSTENM